MQLRAYGGYSLSLVGSFSLIEKYQWRKHALQMRFRACVYEVSQAGPLYWAGSAYTFYLVFIWGMPACLLRPSWWKRDATDIVFTISATLAYFGNSWESNPVSIWIQIKVVQVHMKCENNASE